MREGLPSEMKPLFPDGRQALRSLLRAAPLLAFDYDGTLAPIAVDVRQAVLDDAMAEALRALFRCHPCAVVSGRSRRDLRTLMRGLKPVMLFGNHGMESRTADPRARRWARMVRGVSEVLAPLARVPGVSIEDKRLSLSIHFRTAPEPARASAAIQRAAARLDGVRLIHGKAVVNVLPADAPDKGTAVVEAMARAGCQRALFVGDDLTDEDAFALHPALPVLGVRVGRLASSRAAFYLRRQADVLSLVRRLAG